jgi:hypothetical protein
LDAIAAGVRLNVFAQRGKPSYAVWAMNLSLYKSPTPREKREADAEKRRGDCGS